MKNLKFQVGILLALAFAFLLLPVTFNAQVRPVYDYGVTGLGQLLKRLSTTKSVMMIGAHPDDEDSALLAYLSRGENARTAYLSLNRGDGGQNIIGPELFESLGVIRTEELLQARRLDGAEQYFTRTFDYGFSKTLDEAKQKWDEKIVLCDAVRAIRTFRPLVVIARFSGTPADGHGQHQYAGYISPLAVRAAADANQCPNSGAAWEVKKFYIEQGFRGSSQAALQINTGEYSNLLGRSYAEIASEGRSQHKTQEQGGLELKGDQFSGLNLIESKASKADKETDIFDGIDISIRAIGKLTGNSEKAAAEKLSDLQKIIDQLNQIGFSSGKLLPLLVNGNKIASEAASSTSNGQTKFFLQQQREDFLKALQSVLGLQIDALADRETTVADESFQTTVKVFFPNNGKIKIEKISLKTPGGWQAVESPKAPETNQNAFRREAARETASFSVKVPHSAKLTSPYWLENPRTSALFDWQNDDNQNLPFQPQSVCAEIKVNIDGNEIIFTQPVEFRFADAVRGEVRRDLNVVPKISLNLDQNLLLVSGAGKSHTQNLSLTVINNSSGAISGTAKLDLPNGWQAVSGSPNFSLKNKGDKNSVKFTVTIPPGYKAGSYGISAKADVGGETFTQAMNIVAYPHIQTHRFYTDAKTMVDVLDLKVAPVKVGYIMGSGDEVPAAIRQMGLTVELLDEKDLAGDLAQYDVIVAGIRAYQVRGDLISNNQRILDYIKNGGTLLVQYQRPDYVANNLQPFAASMSDTQRTTAGSTARVVDENAKVTILQPANPVFNYPNKISDADFADWVQERDLYNFVTFDEKYIPLLESHDAGEQENRGGMVYAKIGKGNYVYISYSFFRQLPAGVPGAYRIFANLLSLPKYNPNQKAIK